MAGTADTTTENDFVSYPELFVACTVKVKVPSAVGVPDITPSGDSVSPAGRLLPGVRLQVMDAVPLAARAWL